VKTSSRLLIIGILFTACLLAANTVATKIVAIGPFNLPAAFIVFPISYILGDILTEVYGYKAARRVIWSAFGANLVFVFFVWLAMVMPAASFWDGQVAFEEILGQTPRILLAAFAGYLCGEFLNSFIMAKMKIATKGRFLWMRTIGSTVLGEGVDSFVFITIAFIGTPAFALSIIITHWVAKVLVEIIATPATYFAVGYLKKKEGVDVYDTDTNFNPFKLK